MPVKKTTKKKTTKRRKTTKKKTTKAVVNVAKTQVVEKSEFTPTREQFDTYLLSRANWKTTKIAKVKGVTARTVQRHVKAVADWLDTTAGIQRAKEDVEGLVPAALGVIKLKLAENNLRAAEKVLETTGILSKPSDDPSGMRQMTDRELIGDLIGVIKSFGDAHVVGQLTELLTQLFGRVAESDGQEIPADYGGIETTPEGRAESVHETDEASAQ